MKLKFRYEYIPLVLFVAATLFYINIDKVPLTHPGNIKAADPFTHVLTVMQIKDTQQWEYYDTYVSLGQEKALNIAPPLYHMQIAAISLTTGIPSWVLWYLFVCISQALYILVIYLLTKEIFDSSKIGALAATLLVLPIPVHAWLYGMYIGLWIQVAGYLFLLAFMWLYIRYLKRKEMWALFFIGLCISSVTLLHPQDLLVLFLPTLMLGLYLLYSNRKNIQTLIKKLFVVAFLPAASILLMAERFLYVWKSAGSYAPGWYGTIDLTTQGIRGVLKPSFLVFPLWAWLLLCIGMLASAIVLYLHWKKQTGIPTIPSKEILTITLKKNRFLGKSLGMYLLFAAYYVGVVYLSPLILFSPTYMERARSLQPYVFAPLMGLALYGIIELIGFVVYKLTKQKKYFVQFISIVGIALVAIFLALPQYNALVDSMQYEHLPLDEWSAYKFIHANSNKEDKVLMFGGVGQNEAHFLKRPTAKLRFEELNRLSNIVVQTNTTPIVFNGGWEGSTLRFTHVYKEGTFDYKIYPEPSDTLHLLDFEYVFFQDLNRQIEQANNYFAAQFVTHHGFRPVYDKQGYLIIKNEN